MYRSYDVKCNQGNWKLSSFPTIGEESYVFKRQRQARKDTYEWFGN